MKVSNRGMSFIAAHEGIVLRAYQDPVGIWTIGIGHTSAAGAPKVVRGMTITHAEAYTIFARDLLKFEARVTKAMQPNQQHVADGATSFDFNTGRIHNATWVKHFLSRLWNAAEASLKEWTKAKGKVLKGLVRRRYEEADIIFRDKWPAEIEDRSESTVVDEVASYQTALKTLGYYTGDVDGIRGPLTNGAVLNFQRDHDLVVDGKVGPATRAALHRALEARQANQQSGGGAAAGGAGAGGADASGFADINIWQGVIIAALIAAAIWGGWWVYRNRGRVAALVKGLLRG